MQLLELQQLTTKIEMLGDTLELTNII